jgi:uncharacterized alpha-E superfamily protein
MLSKVAERIYWTARYLERVESTARLVSIYDKLLFDLPRRVNIGWYNLIVINGIEAGFNEQYSVRDERNVMKYLLGEKSNPGSIVSSLNAIRENIRTSRDVVPFEIWELINELSMYVGENLQQGINRSKRHEFLEEVIQGCQTILGLIYGTMPHDSAWEFMRLGRYLERADMTTRNLDAGVAAVIQTEDDEFSVNSHQIIWGNVLRSLNADQSYRRKCRASVSNTLVVRYLLENEEFPKSVGYCIGAIIDSCNRLPNSKALLDELAVIKDKIYTHREDDLMGEPLRNYLNDLQILIGHVNRSIAQEWFPKIETEMTQTQSMNSLDTIES